MLQLETVFAAGEPSLPFFGFGQDHRHCLFMHRPHDVVRFRRQESVELPGLLNPGASALAFDDIQPFATLRAPDTGEEGYLLIRQAEPDRRSRRLGKGGERHKAAMFGF